MQVVIGVCEWLEDHDFYHMLLDDSQWRTNTQ
jgi:hypothetical protein